MSAVPGSFFDTSPQATMTRSESESSLKLLRHRRSFSRLLFRSSKSKSEEKVSFVAPENDADLLQRKDAAKRLGSSHRRNETMDTFSLPPKKAESIRTLPGTQSIKSSFSSSSFFTPSKKPLLNTPTRPSTRPSYNILSDDPFLSQQPLSPSRAKPRNIDTKLASMVEMSGHSAASSISTNNSSIGPPTPADEPPPGIYFRSMSASTDSSPTSQRGHKVAMSLSMSTSMPPLPTFPSYKAICLPASQPVTPTKKNPSQNHNTVHISRSAPRPSLSLSMQPKMTPPKINDPARRVTLTPPSPTTSSKSTTPTSTISPRRASALTPSPSTPALREALIAEKRRCQVLSTRLHYTEAAKEESERKIHAMEIDAASRARELEGLRYLLLNMSNDMSDAGVTSNPPEHGKAKLKRTSSMPYMPSPSSSSSPSPSPEFALLNTETTRPLVIRGPKCAGLGIKVSPPTSSARRSKSPDSAPPRGALPALPESSSNSARGVPVPIHVHHFDTSPSDDSLDYFVADVKPRDVRRLNTLAQLDLLKEDLGQRLIDCADR